MIIRRALFLILSLFICLSSSVLAQNSTTQITGRVLDEGSNSPVPFANVALVSKGSNSIFTGITTDESGRFEIQTDSINFNIEVSFMGYQKLIIDNVNPNKGKVNLGDLVLLQNAQNLDAVEITAERSTVEFKLDKRVFNIGSDISSTGMGALDVLNNVPSVNVDIEGNISLRGNTGVQVLIDGKPSVMADDGAKALGAISADMIDRIEVITNPSAKYEAEGTSGIINIVLKKEEKKGLNGSGSVNVGYPYNNSLGLSINRRTENFNLFSQLGAGFRSIPQYRESVNYNRTDGTTIISEGIEYRNERFYNITLGTDYHLNNRNVITLSGRYAFEDEKQPSEIDYKFLNQNKELVEQYKRTETTTAANPKYQYDLQYHKEFKNNEEHTLEISTLGKFFGKEQSSEFLNTPILGTNPDPNQQTETNFYQRDYIFKVDYSNPINEVFSLEAGGVYEMNDVGNEYAVYNWNDIDWVVDPNLTNLFEYDQKVLGLYSTGAFEGKKWGVKMGARVENTDLNTLLTNTNQQNTQDYTNFFPSMHASYKMSKMVSFQTGYSRRIYRPRLWDLNPFFNIRNSYNIRRGNPNLLPEYANSFEVTGIFILKNISLNSSVYHLYTTDVIERVAYFENNAKITTPENIGTRQKTGIELNGKYSPTKWLSFNGDANYGYFVRQGEFENQNFDFEGDQWSTQLTTKFKLPFKIDLELTGDYQSRYKTVQGKVSGFVVMDAGLRKKLWDGKGILNFGVRDIFISRITESYIDQPGFYLYENSTRGRFFVLGFSYSFGKGEAMTYNGGRR